MTSTDVGFVISLFSTFHVRDLYSIQNTLADEWWCISCVEISKYSMINAYTGKEESNSTFTFAPKSGMMRYAYTHDTLFEGDDLLEFKNILDEYLLMSSL